MLLFIISFAFIASFATPIIIAFSSSPEILIYFSIACGFGISVGCFAVRIADHYTPPPLCSTSADPAGPAKTLGSTGSTVIGAVTVLLLLAVWVRLGVGWAALPPAVAVTALVVLSTIDLRSYRLPDAVQFPALGISFTVIAVVSLIMGKPAALATALAASLGYGLFMLILHELNPRGLGFGDVKLSLLLGLHLGWVAHAFHNGGPDVVLLVGYAVIISSCSGLVLGLLIAVLRRRGRNILPDPERISHPRDVDQASGNQRSQLLATAFPFGPALSAGTLTVVLFSDILLG